VEVDVLHSDTAIQSPVTPGPPRTYSLPPAAGPPAAAPPATGAQPVTSVQPVTPYRSPAGGQAAARQYAVPADAPGQAGPGGPPVPAQEQPETFAEWMSSALRREGLTQEAAARQLGVSVKTVSRWVGGATEPRMRDLRRIQEVFGEVPLP
ncbi:MAG: helix-turn-helix transcriptional regulator, partial [Streptosporangiaceae bacterium]